MLYITVDFDLGDVLYYHGHGSWYATSIQCDSIPGYPNDVNVAPSSTGLCSLVCWHLIHCQVFAMISVLFVCWHFIHCQVFAMISVLFVCWHFTHCQVFAMIQFFLYVDTSYTARCLLWFSSFCMLTLHTLPGVCYDSVLFVCWHFIHCQVFAMIQFFLYVDTSYTVRCLLWFSSFCMLTAHTLFLWLSFSKNSVGNCHYRWQLD